MSPLQVHLTMEFNKYDVVELLDDSRDDWTIQVRAQSIWKGITKATGAFRGYNIIFFDDSSCRIHAFISAKITPKFENVLEEGKIYNIKNFTVKTYNGDETNRFVRNEKHVFFQNDTEMEVVADEPEKFPSHSFDFFSLDQIDSLKKDNRFLTDVVAVVEDVQTKATYTKDSGEKSHVAFTINDGMKSISVTFFNEFGDSFLKAKECFKDEPVIIIISCGKVSEWKEMVYLTNFPSTRFYLNLNHPAVNELKLRYLKPDFYTIDLDDDIEVHDMPIMKVSDIRKLDGSYVQKKVLCEVTVKKFYEKMNWYSPFCIQCDQDLQPVDGIYKCCNRSYPYPDKRFGLYSLSSDETGTISIIWPNDEISRLTGKTIYDVESEELETSGDSSIPPILKSFEKKIYQITILLAEENIKSGSKVYYATNISNPIEVSDTHEPNAKKHESWEKNKIPTVHVDKVIVSKDNSPPTEASTTRCRSRLVEGTVKYSDDPNNKIQKLKQIKLEKN